MERYNDFNSYMRGVFGKKAVKLSLNGDFSCPNKESGQGCLFCSDSGHYAGSLNKPVSYQILEQKKLLGKKWSDCVYIAYFGTDTSTYSDTAKQKKLFDEALRDDSIKGLAIATRPDCISAATLDLLAGYASSHFVWIELGLQTIHTSSHKYLNTGYDFEIFKETYKRLAERKLRTTVHLIFGLPGENKEMMLQSAKSAGLLLPFGIKFHMLYILNPSPMYDAYLTSPFEILTMDQYAQIVKEALEFMPKETVIQRLTGDAPRKYLYRPLWTADKRKVLQLISKKQILDDSFQGKLFCDNIL